jgi:hypothetical protein
MTQLTIYEVSLRLITKKRFTFYRRELTQDQDSSPKRKIRKHNQSGSEQK